MEADEVFLFVKSCGESLHIEDYSGQEITIEQSCLNFHSRQELEDDDA